MANNKIKGLTVEIGGDTTNLGKALESANKMSGDLSSELGAINRLLKFDPDNAELLAQKQKVLADTIGNTSDKLKILREAEKQVQAQFARGDVSAEQVRTLQREIIATEGRLNHYQEEAKKAKKGTKDLGDEAGKTGGAFEGMGAKIASAAKVGIGAVVAGATAAVGALVASAEATREYRAEMGKLDTAFQTVGYSTAAAEDAYNRLYGVIGETDQAVEAAQQIALLANSEKDVAQWADLAAGVVARFGDALQPETFFEAANETIKLGEATGAYTQMLEGVGYDVEKFNAGLAACTTEQEKQAYMLGITEELLGSAAGMYRETNAEVIRANEANEAWTATMAEVGASVEPILTDVKMLGASLLGELIPGITAVTDAFRGLVNGEEGSAEQVGEALNLLLTDVLGKVVEILPTVVETARSLLTSLTLSLVEMLPQLVQTMVDVLLTGIPQLIEGAVQLLLSILDAIPLILPPLIEALPQIVMTLINGLLMAIPELIEAAFDFLMAIVAAIPLLIGELIPLIPKIVDTVIDGLLDCIPELVDGAVQLLFGILEAVPQIQAALWKETPNIVKSIVQGLLKSIPALWKAGVQLLEGLIDGMLDFDYMGAIRGIGNAIVDGFKSIFDIHSPSRVMMGIGELLDEGLAEGIADNAKAPVNALDKLSSDMLDSTEGFDGVTLERRMVHAFSADTASSPMDGLSAKLDQIYRAILSGKVIMLDSKTLVGSTVDRYDTELGQRRILAERGAL